MSMYRQLWLSIFASALLALLASLFASLYNARGYIETQLALKNRDNAAALAMALSSPEHEANDVIVAATALFNSGQYELVQVLDPEGKLLIEHVAREEDSGVPVWFRKALPLRSQPGEAQISAGWQPLGTLTLMSQSEFAYRSLWRTALIMTGVILIAGVLGALLVSLVLRRLHLPMQAVIDQARAITEHRFVTIPEPDVPELKQLAHAMNDTVGRLRQQFDNDARRYDNLRRSANFDTLTGLARRAFFLASLDNALASDDSLYGALALVRLPELGRVNREHGRENADEILRRVGHTLATLSPYCSGTYAGRLSGADFGLLLPAGCETENILRQLLAEIQSAVEPLLGADTPIAIGHADFVRCELPNRLLARIDAAIATIEANGGQAVLRAEDDRAGDLPASADAWRTALREALEGENRLKLAQHAIRLRDDPASHRECPLRIRLQEDGEWLPASRFVPIAERLGEVRELDLAGLRLALDMLANDDSLGGVWINLSAQSIADEEFLGHMRALLDARPEQRRRLWLEIPEAAGLRRIGPLREMAREMKQLGCHLGLEHYGHHFSQIGLLYDLGLDFLKIDASFVHDIDRNTGNQAFLGGLCEIAHRIGMRLYAEGVETEAEQARLTLLGFDGMTGKSIREA